MTGRSPRISILSLAASCILAAPVSAQNVVLSGTVVFNNDLTRVAGLQPGAFTFSMMMPQEPTDYMPYSPDEFWVTGLTASFTQGTTTVDVRDVVLRLFGSNRGGGFTLQNTRLGFPSLQLYPTGPEIFTRSPGMSGLPRPTFTTGSYAITRNIGIHGDISRFSIALATPPVTAAPEPATIALVVSGLVALGGRRAC